MARSISDEELQLKRRARRRLIGAIVLVTVIVVVLPMVLDTEPKPISGDVSIKIPSTDSGNFTSRVVPIAPPADKGSEPGRAAPETKAATRSADKSPGASAPKTAKPAETQAAPKVEKPAPDAVARAAEPAAKAPPVGPAGESFVVQVVALADAEKAKEVQAQIALVGLSAYTEVVKTAKGDVTRVRAGPFPSRPAAEKAQEQLKAIGLSGNIVPK